MTEHCEKCSELADVYRAENTELKARLEEAERQAEQTHRAWKWQDDAILAWQVRAEAAERRVAELTEQRNAILEAGSSTVWAQRDRAWYIERVAELEATVVPTIRGLRAYGSWNANELADKLEAWLARAALSPDDGKCQTCRGHGHLFESGYMGTDKRVTCPDCGGIGLAGGATPALSPQTPESEQEIEAEQYQATVDTLVGEGPQEETK